jgi:hypothetical protein
MEPVSVEASISAAAERRPNEGTNEYFSAFQIPTATKTAT